MATKAHEVNRRIATLAEARPVSGERAGKVAPAEIEAVLLALVEARGPGKTIGPADVARAIGGDHPDGWGPLMQPVRRAAVRLVKHGRIVILRKGKPVDPDDFRGTYRIALAGSGAGSSASV